MLDSHPTLATDAVPNCQNAGTLTWGETGLFTCNCVEGYVGEWCQFKEDSMPEWMVVLLVASVMVLLLCSFYCFSHVTAAEARADMESARDMRDEETPFRPLDL